MKRIYALIAVIIMALPNAECQSKKAESFLKDQGFLPVTEDYLYCFETEISNRQYREFLDWTLKNKGKETYFRMYPDTTVWRDKLSYNEPFVLFYFQHPAYLDYPLVGISWEQARAYCLWKAERIMESKAFKNSPIEKIIVRLPSEQEWMKAARGTLPVDAVYPWPGDKIRWMDGNKKDQGKIRLNCKRATGDVGGYFDSPNASGLITTPVSSYWPNTTGLYNMSGNVAEWVEEKNKAKGGGWNSLPYNCRIDIAPESAEGKISISTIGFRPVLEIVSYKTDPKKAPYTLTPKTLEKRVKMINDTLGAAMYETSNQLYNLFLNETKNLTDSVQGYQWSEYSRYEYFAHYHQNPLFSEYPVVNISHESARHFCEWLTARYNQSGNRTYKQVVFRLPTNAEWELAAGSGTGNQSYPWAGPYFLNSKGCYMANFNPMEEEYLCRDSSGNTIYNYPGDHSEISRGADGCVYTAPVNSYYPNKSGLFNCAGNVAEMISEKGISKGGSWNSPQPMICIGANETYSGPYAGLGFRFVMVVKEK